MKLAFRPRPCWLLLGLLAAAGCGGGQPPPPADPAQARVALRLALDAWKKGDQPEALKERQPPVIAVDHDWRDGDRLLGYQVEKEEPFGADLRCQVVLSVRSKKGQIRQKKAAYSVGTGATLTVIREDP